MYTDGHPIRILLVEDEESYREAIASGLRREGYQVDLAGDGPSGLVQFSERPPDIVLLDVLLPGMHGTEVCRRMRALAPVPILMVSAVSSELDVVLGLELGATDYVTKPFHLRELVARIQAVLRRMAPAGRAAAEPRPGPPPDGPRRDPGGRTEISFGPVQVDFIRREVTVGERTVHLSRREFDLLAVLLSPARQVRTREELIDLLWPGRELTDSRTLDTHVHRLRTKLEPDPTSPRYLVTVRGVGFRLDPDGERPRPHTRPVTPGPVSAGPTPGRLSRSGR